MSKYQFAESEIHLPGTDIPRNRLGIEEPDLLHEVEATLLQQAYIAASKLKPNSTVLDIACGPDVAIALHCGDAQALGIK